MKSKAHNKWETSRDSCEANCSRVNKLDCVGHVQKRMMGKNLIGLTGRKKLADGKPVGGRAGRLTRPTTDKLQKYYGNAIRRCVHKKAKTKSDVNKPHHLDPVFQSFFLTPLYERLSDKKLLKRCLPGLSQNANESVNSLVWNRCPKYRYRGFTSAETAAGSAALQLNIGAAGRHDIMKELGIPDGSHTKHGSKRGKKGE